MLAAAPGVLIPRPETEALVDLAAEALDRHPALGGLDWADLGTGTGAIAIGVARLLPPGRSIWAVDKAEAPAALAAWNASRLLGGPGQQRVRVVRGSWLEPLGHLRGRLGGILSNPPYIPRMRLAGLQREVRDHEPSLALDGGEGQGLDSLKDICGAAADHLAKGGFLALETDGPEQAHWAAGALQAAGFTGVEVRRDCYGVERFVLGYSSTGF